MVNLFSTPLGPGLILLLGALVLSLARQRVPRPVVRVTALVAVITAAGMLLWVVLSGRPARLSLAWDPVTLPGGVWLWQIDTWSWLAACVLFLLAGVAVLLAWDEPRSGSAASLSATLLLVAAASFFLFSGNLLTLAATWLVLDAAVGLSAAAEGAGEGGRAWGLSSVGTVLLLGALLFAGPAGVQNRLSDNMAPVSLLALLLASLLRCGAYPLHIWQSAHIRRSRRELIALHLIAPLTGLWLLGELHVAISPYFRSQPAWAGLGVLGMLGSALAALLQPEGTRRNAWVAVNRVSLGVLVAVLAPQQGPAAIIWPLLALTLGVGTLVVGEAIAQKWGWRQPLALAVLTLIGLPGTPGFAARLVWADVSTLSPALWPLWLLALVAETLLAAALFPVLFLPRREAQPPTSLVTVPRLLAAAVLMAGPLLVWGLRPPLLARFAGLSDRYIVLQPLSAQLQQVTPVGWAALLVPWAAGAMLAWARTRLPAGLGDRQHVLRRVVSLEWAYEALRWAVVRAADMLRGLGGVIEGEGYWGWLGLAALLGWLVWNL